MISSSANLIDENKLEELVYIYNTHEINQIQRKRETLL